MIEMTKFNYDNLKLAIKYNNMNVKDLPEFIAKRYGEEYRRDYDSTFRRYIKKGEMPKEYLEKIAEFLNVEFDYLKGKYDNDYDILGEYKDGMLHPAHYPFLHNLDSKFKTIYEGYLGYLLSSHRISPKQYAEKTDEEKIQLALELEEAIVPVLMRFFNEDAYGNETKYELWRIWINILDYKIGEIPEPDDEWFQEYNDYKSRFDG